MTLFTYMRENKDAPRYAALGLVTSFISIVLVLLLGTLTFYTGIIIIVTPYLVGLLVNMLIRYYTDRKYGKGILSVRAMQTSGEYYIYYYLKWRNT